MSATTTSPPPARRERAAELASWLLCLAPFLFYAVVLPQFGALQRNDYWDDFLGVLDDDGRLTSDPRAWLGARSNEHWIGAQLPIWLANYALTGGDNRGLAALSLVFLVATFALLYRQLPEAVRKSPQRRVLWALPLAAGVATPAAAHNWVMGFSGNQWFLANLLAVAALARLARGPHGRARDLAAVALPLTLATIVHGTFLALAAALAAGATALRLPRRTRIAVLALAAAAAVLFFAGYRRPEHHPAPSREPRAVAAFTLDYLGGAFTERPGTARGLGAFGLVLFVAGVAGLRRAPRAAGEAVWPLVAVYATAAACGTAVGRAGYGEEVAATTSRYASLQALFWIGTFATVALVLRARRPPAGRAVGAVATATVVVCLAANVQLGVARLTAQLDQVRWQPVAALALRWGVRDQELLAHVTPFLSPKSLRFFRRIEHVPFDRAPEGPPGAVLALPRAHRVPSGAGSWSGTRDLPGNYVRVSGTLPEDADGRGLVVLLDSDGAIRGAAVPLPEPAKGAALLLGRRPPPRYWIGYAGRHGLGQVTPVFLPANGGEPYALRVDRRARKPVRQPA